LIALVLVATLAYSRTRSLVRSAALPALAFVIAVVGAIVYLAAAWPTES
jgi:hypothetical protein